MPPGSVGLRRQNGESPYTLTRSRRPQQNRLVKKLATKRRNGPSNGVAARGIRNTYVEYASLCMDVFLNGKRLRSYAFL